MKLPEPFRRRILSQKYIDPEGLFSALSEQSRTSIRINRLKWDKKPADSEKVPWCSDGYILSKRPSFTFDPLFHSGCYYPQESSGMFLEQVFMQVAGRNTDLKVLDLCGAPGGKSTHLSSILGNGSLLVSNEVIRSRASVLAENLTKWGRSNSIVTQSDPSAFSRLAGFFDMIVVDAPCSGEGMFRDAIAINEWSENNAALCSERQKRILLDVWPALKTGGILVYSTCTFNTAENEENVKWLSDKRKAETVRLHINDYQGVTEIEHDGIYGYGFYPGKIKGEGFFISVLKKTDEQIVSQGKNKSGSFARLSGEEERVAREWMKDPGTLLKAGNDITSVPCNYDVYRFLYENLKVIKHGTKAGCIKNGAFLPDHDLAMSDLLNKEACPVTELNFDQALSFLSRTNLSLSDIPKGWNLMRYNTISLGFVKNVGSRLNNYYPVEWRIKTVPVNFPEIEKIRWE